MKDASPQIRTAEEASQFMQSLRDSLKLRNADLRTLGPGKALHIYAEARHYDNWQQCRAAFMRAEFIETMTRRYNLNRDVAEVQWSLLNPEEIKAAENGTELADHSARTHAVVPSARPVRNERTKANRSHLKQLLEAHAVKDDEPDRVDYLVYGKCVSSIEIQFVLSLNSNLYLRVDDEGEVLSGRIRTSGFDESEALDLTEQQLKKIGELFQSDIERHLAKL